MPFETSKLATVIPVTSVVEGCALPTCEFLSASSGTFTTTDKRVAHPLRLQKLRVSWCRQLCTAARTTLHHLSRCRDASPSASSVGTSTSKCLGYISPYVSVRRPKNNFVASQYPLPTFATCVSKLRDTRFCKCGERRRRLNLAKRFCQRNKCVNSPNTLHL